MKGGLAKYLIRRALGEGKRKKKTHRKGASLLITRGMAYGATSVKAARILEGTEVGIFRAE